jgi:hypothetical protein
MNDEILKLMDKNKVRQDSNYSFGGPGVGGPGGFEPGFLSRGNSLFPGNIETPPAKKNNGKI